MSSDPIGHVIDDHGLAIHRVPLPAPGVPHADRGGREADVADTFFYARAYRVDLGGSAVMAIAEWFLADLQAYLPEHDGSTARAPSGPAPRRGH